METVFIQFRKVNAQPFLSAVLSACGEPREPTDAYSITEVWVWRRVNERGGHSGRRLLLLVLLCSMRVNPFRELIDLYELRAVVSNVNMCVMFVCVVRVFYVCVFGCGKNKRYRACHVNMVKTYSKTLRKGYGFRWQNWIKWNLSILYRITICICMIRWRVASISRSMCGSKAVLQYILFHSNSPMFSFCALPPCASKPRIVCPLSSPTYTANVDVVCRRCWFMNAHGIERACCVYSMCRMGCEFECVYVNVKRLCQTAVC